MNSVGLFFEIICFCELPEYESLQIINHLECLQNNESLNEIQNEHRNFNCRSQDKKRKVFFNFLNSNNNVYYYLSELDNFVINLIVLLKNRKNSEVYMMSNCTNNLVTAVISGFCIIPIANTCDSMEYELHLAEKYLLASRWNKNPREQNRQDFAILTEIPIGGIKKNELHIRGLNKLKSIH